jgi:hypothetical protein
MVEPDAIVELIGAFQATGSALAARRSMTLLDEVAPADEERLWRRASERCVEVALAGLRALSLDVQQGGRLPDNGEWQELADGFRDAQRDPLGDVPPRQERLIS